MRDRERERKKSGECECLCVREGDREDYLAIEANTEVNIKCK